MLDYYEYNWEKLGGLDYTNILKLCDQITLRTDVILQLYGDTFSKVILVLTKTRIANPLLQIREVILLF